nr:MULTISPECIES: PepSY domain-containing protein [Bacillaceae]
MSTNQKKKRQSAFYQTVWRWHFYAGVIFAPFLFILAFSGGVYLFKPQIEGYLYSEYTEIEQVEDQRLYYTNQADSVREAYPDSSITSVIVHDEQKATEFLIQENGVGSSVFVNPFTAEVTGIVNNDAKLTEIFKRIHSELWIAGTVGNRIVELAACWAVILIVTGLYIWWPRNKKAIWGTILPRLKKKGRMFWRELHAVPAFWLSAAILLLIVTGLPWSGVLGPQIQSVATSPPYAYSFGEKPESVTVTEDVVDEVPWANENLPVPFSIQSSYLPLSMDDSIHLFEQHAIKKPFSVSMPQGETGVYTASHMDVPKDLATLHMDQYSGAILSDVRYDDFGFGAKLVESGIALHEGRLFGWVNQALGLITCLGLMGLIGTSFVMWRKRAPKGTFAAPRKATDPKTTWVVFGIMALFGILMPLVGLSLLVLLFIDFVIRPLFFKKEDQFTM